MNSLPLALVTGSAHRLGFLFARTLSEQGYAILLHYHHSRDDAESAAQKLRALDTPVYLAQADLTEPREILDLFAVVDAIPHPLRVL
ncbi:MAG: SDR family NAD(P)-dependent oxidoreductase, partial [Anaerolineales bacterium]|nr:SDR family NAD(P)-dependent oxidoreductase [Anaerolineales bacterium]